MGERGTGSAPLARQQAYLGPWVLAGALALLALVSLLPRQLDPASRTALALAQSLALDLDRAWGEADRERLRQRHPTVAPGESPPLPLLRQRKGREEPAGELLHALYLAPWTVFGERGALLGQAFLLALAALLAARALGRVAGSQASWLVLLLLLASPLFLYALRLWADGFHAALVTLALALAWGGAFPRQGQLAEIYQPPGDEGGLPLVLRWAAAGALLGGAAAARPQVLPLLVGAALLVPDRRRRLGVPVLLVAAFVTLVALWIAEGAGAAAGPAAWLEALGSGAKAASGVGEGGLGLAAGERIAPRLWQWNALYLVAGRHVGALFYLAPALLLMVGAGGGRGRRALLAGAAAGVLLTLWLRPFDFSGAPWSHGPAALLPLLPAVAFALARAPGRAALAATWLWAAAFLWPAWVAPLASPVGEGGKRPWVASYLAPWAPFETTQPGLRSGREAVAGELRLVPLSAGARPAAGPGRLMIPGERRAEVLVESPRRLSAVNLEIGEGGGAEIELRGGELAETLLRPDGGVEFLIDLRRPAATHPTRGHPAEVYFYRLSLSIPAGPPRLLSLRIAGIPEEPRGS